MNEGKKGVRAKKHRVAHIEPSKPRNFVAKNAIGGGAGAHKDKKKAMKQGDSKHKKDYVEHLESMLSIEMLVERQINETGLDPIRRMKAIQYIVSKTGWERNYVELASDEELMDIFVKLKKGQPVEDAGVSKEQETEFHSELDKLVHKTFGKRADEDAVDDFIKAGGKIQYGKPQKGPKRPGLSFSSKHIGVAGGGGKASKISGLGANTRKTAKPVVKAGKEWTHDSLAAELFEQELTYEDSLKNKLEKELKKK